MHILSTSFNVENKNSKMLDGVQGKKNLPCNPKSSAKISVYNL